MEQKDLKTIEEFCPREGADNLVCRIEMKEEAIKWIKRFVSDYPGLDIKDFGRTWSPNELIPGEISPFAYKMNTMRDFHSDEPYSSVIFVIQFIKHFFNIKDEDLK